MGLSIVTSGGYAIAARGRGRRLAAIAAGLELSAALITRFGNVPINLEIKQWASVAPPAGCLDRLQSGQLYNDVRVAAAVVAFLLIVR